MSSVEGEGVAAQPGGGTASPTPPTIWPVLHYDDAAAALRFLVDAFGFREALAVTDDEAR